MGNRFRTGVWVAIATAIAASLGGTAALLNGRQPQSALESAPIRQEAASDDPTLALVQASPDQRSTELAKLATGRGASRHRARYLLAADAIQQGRGGSALPLLQDLEADYPLLAPYVLKKRGQAQTASGQAEAAQETWQQLVETHPEDPAAAEALFQLAQSDPAAADQLLERFPAHPRSLQLAQQRLSDDPNRADALPLLLLLARHGLYQPGIESVLDRLSDEFAAQLTPEHWQLIGFGYWELTRYGKAGAAYTRAPESPRSLYRAARGLQLDQRRTQAIEFYRRLDQTFPEAEETGLGLMRLADVVPLEEAPAVLDQVISRFPARAAEALAERSEVLIALDSPESAAAATQSILSQHADSETAAELRLERAFAAAETGDLAAALQWSQELVENGPATEAAAAGGFWAGRWARQLGQGAVAQQALEQVIADHPESYYAWRSAVALGWPVGDFKTVRFETPSVSLPQRQTLPAGSDALQELYQLGQDRDAWARWQVEFEDVQEPTVAEQFTDGLMRLGVGDNLDGIYMISSLSWRDQPEEKAEYQQLKQSPDYWRALYPFPYVEPIQRWSQQRQLNPLLVTALIRQESRFEPQIRSVVGAAGLMQVMPETAAWIQGQTGMADYNLDDPESNIELGTWYLDFTHQEYQNNSLFAVASYNAGPGNVADWIGRGNYRDADEFVEVIPFPETQGYVRAVFGGYWNYLRLYDDAIATRVAQLQNP